MIDYFTEYKKGESYTYGLKCTSSVYDVDVRDVVYIGENEKRIIQIVHDTHSRKFIQVHVAARADVRIEINLSAPIGTVIDSYVDIVHEGNEGKSEVIVRGCTEGNGRIICRIRAHVPHEVFHVTATQDVSLYQFGVGGIIDCIPVLEIKNKTTNSKHAVRLEKISDIEYWYAARIGISSHVFQNMKKQSLATQVI